MCVPLPRVPAPPPQTVFAAAGALVDSQLLTSPQYRPQGAMCASELMDPKMDMGIRLINRHFVEDKLASGELGTEFSAPVVHSVFDKLFQLEVGACGRVCCV